MNNNFKATDFGNGFYTTPDLDSATKWANRKAIALKSKPSIVCVYADDEKIKSIVTEFQDDLRWGRFIINNRNGMSYIKRVSFHEHNLDAKYDVTCGKIADLDVYNISKKLNETSELLEDLSSILNPGYPLQYAFHTSKGLDCIQKMLYRNV